MLPNTNASSRRAPRRDRPPARLPWAFLLTGLLGLGAGGCATGDVAMLATIAGGEQIRVPLGRNGAELTNEAGVQINSATFTLNADKKIVFAFEFTDSQHRALRSVRVADVSDEVTPALVDSASPAPTATGQWRGESAPLELSDPRLGWMATVSNTVRVFRFTLTFVDGQTLVLHQGTLYPAVFKSAVRQSLGQKY
ncbi:MAG: hypothetical protein NTV51_11270 [Verrucomicrobia bacterium]|nr:hypothetical protein [Verrucomicrobiota bacterium]